MILRRSLKVHRRYAVDLFFGRYARRTTAVLARAGIRRATVIERQCREMSEVSRERVGEGIFPIRLR